MIDTFTMFLIKKHADIGEIILGLFATSWGFWLLLPFWDTFSLPVFAAFLWVAPESIWGIGAFLLGILTIVFANTDLLDLRKVLIFFNIFFWVFVAVMLSFASPENTAVPIYTMLSVYAFWRYVKLIVLDKIEKRFVSK